MRRAMIFSYVLTLALLVLQPVVGFAAVADTPPAPARPNVVFILADDLGMMDVGCYGSTYHETPNIDRLAAQGMRFTQAYAACCVCSPTRCSILTGRTPARVGITDWIPGSKRVNPKLLVAPILNELPLEIPTIAEVLRANGYATASIGKWHLGGPAFYPEKHGFDLNVAGTEKGSPPSYFSPYRIATLPDGPAGEHLTDRLADEAEKYIEQHKDRPFFLYLPHFAVHTPIQAKKELIAKYQAKQPKAEQKNPTYAAMVESLDDAVGRVMKKLDDLKLTEKTILIFFSDNGGLSSVNGKPGPTNNSPLRGGKGSPYEGGVREPLLVRCPGVVKAGTVCETPIISDDFFPTLMELTGATVPKPLPVDGVSIVPLLKQTGTPNRDTFYWHYPHYHPGGATPNGSIRQRDWKLIEYFEDGRAELFDLKNDPYEKTDFAAKEPERVAAMRKALAEWRTKVGAKMPTPNPEYKP